MTLTRRLLLAIIVSLVLVATLYRLSAQTGGDLNATAHPLVGDRQDVRIGQQRPSHGSQHVENKPSETEQTVGSATTFVRDRHTRALILGYTRYDNISWLDTAQLQNPDLKIYAYSVDDRDAPLHTPYNKGHEVMPYLTYIRSHYGDPALADVNIFVHSHRSAWHTPDLLNHDVLEVLRRLSSTYVLQTGYTNLRCAHDPGCPERVHPSTGGYDRVVPEQRVIAAAWPTLFPDEVVPDALGTPCCGQFAVSASRIRSMPESAYQRYYDWLIDSTELDYISGRVFEHLWQKIFTGKNKYCPSEDTCYCQGYGVCFGDGQLQEWQRLKLQHGRFYDELVQWTGKAEQIDLTKELEALEVLDIEVPFPGHGRLLQAKVDTLYHKLAVMRTAALRNGTNMRLQAEVARDLHPANSKL